jgi:hypothetical protein
MVERPEVIKDALLLYAEEELDWGDFSEFTNSYSVKPGDAWEIPLNGELTTFTLVDFHDYNPSKNYDGWAEHIWQVWEVNGVLYRITGHHTSYTGTTWADNMTIVVPKLKTITIYEDSNGLPYIS